MKIFIYFLEAAGTFIAIALLNIACNWLLQKKCNQVTAAFFSFAIIGITIFVTGHYVITFPHKSLFYIPFLLFFLFYNIQKASLEKKK